MTELELFNYRKKLMKETLEKALYIVETEELKEEEVSHFKFIFEDVYRTLQHATATDKMLIEAYDEVMKSATKLDQLIKKLNSAKN